MKVLFLVPYPTEGASNRLRVEQYLPFLKQDGIEYMLRPFVSKGFYRILYLRGHYIKKIFYFVICTIDRLFDIVRAIWFDIIFIHRETYPIGFPFMEKIFRLMRKKMIFDFDDAIFLPASSGSNIFIERFNRYGKVPETIAMSDYVIAGNKYLAEFGLKYNENVSVIPTPVDIDTYKSTARKSNYGKITIGWIGSKTTSVFLEPIREVFTALLDKYPNVDIRIVGDSFDTKGLERIENVKWSLTEEIKILQSFDIGIMPMPDTKWTRGKCAFKAILYMSVGIPCVSSPVGMVLDIIRDGYNGFLAKDTRAWIDKLSRLIDDSGIREDFSKRGRELIEELYSVRVNAPKFINVLEKTYEKKKY